MGNVLRRLSAIICTCDRYDVLPAAIASVLAQTVAVDCIVIDNSADGAGAAAFADRYRGQPLRYFYEPVQGLSNARNKGLALAHGNIVAFLDDDAVAAAGWAERLLSAFALHPEAGCVGGRIVPRWLAARPDWLADDLLGYLSLVDLGSEIRAIGGDEWLAGCNIAYERELLVAIGGFPVGLGRKGTSLLSNEEMKVSERIKAAGRSIVYAPDAVVEHLIPAERLAKSWFLRRVAWQAVSDYVAFQQPPERFPAFSRWIGRFGATGEQGNFRSEMQNVYQGVLVQLHRHPGFIENVDTDRDFLKETLGLSL